MMTERRQSVAEANKAQMRLVIIGCLLTLPANVILSWITHRSDDSTSVATILQHQADSDAKLNKIITWQENADSRYVSLPVFNMFKQEFDKDAEETQAARTKAQQQRDDQSEKISEILAKLNNTRR